MALCRILGSKQDCPNISAACPLTSIPLNLSVPRKTSHESPFSRVCPVPSAISLASFSKFGKDVGLSTAPQLLQKLQGDPL